MADQGGGPMPDPVTPPAPGGPGINPQQDPTRDEYYAFRFMTPPWITAGFPDYASYAKNLVEKEANARALQEKAINAPAGAAGVSASITNAGANQRAAAQNEITRAQDAATNAHNAALLALQQGNAAEARRQFDISSQELARSHQADEQLRQQGQDLASSKFGNDVYNKLAELASNPRNYMEQFFRLRGQQPPPGSAQFGNSPMGGPSLMTLDQFLPNFLRSTGLSAGGQGAVASPSAAAASPTSGVEREGGGMQQDIARTYSGQADRARTWTQQIGNDPRAGAVPGSGGAFMSGATQNGVFNPQAGTRTENPFGAENSGQQYDPAARQAQNIDFEKQVAAQNNVKYMAGGGTLRMTEPHAIVNLLSGKVAAIAGEQPGRGPHGFVPEQAKFSGQAYSAGYDTGSDWTPPDTKDPFTPTPVEGFPNVFAGSTAPPLTPDTSLRTTSPDFAPQTTPAPSAAPTPAPGYSGASTPGGYFGTPTTPSEPLTTEAAAPILQDTTGGTYNRTLNQYAPAGSPSPEVGPGAPVNPDLAPPGGVPISPTMAPTSPMPFIPTPTPPPAPSTGTTPVPVTTGPSTATPLINPTGSNAWGGPISTPSVPSFLSDFMQTPSGLGRNPQFLPETQDPITNEMIKAGTFPPFLQRIFAQQKGLAGLGTNVPQQTNLPEGVPLVSSLALSQMAPSELSAFQSFVSSHGMDWNDYLDLVKKSSPEGGPSNPNPAIPTFLGQ